MPALDWLQIKKIQQPERVVKLSQILSNQNTDWHLLRLPDLIIWLREANGSNGRSAEITESIKWCKVEKGDSYG